jgi:hypothetical protein
MSIGADLARCDREIARIQEEARAGIGDAHGIYQGLHDWRTEKRAILLLAIDEQVVATGICGADLEEVRYRLRRTTLPILDEIYRKGIVKQAERIVLDRIASTRTSLPNGSGEPEFKQKENPNG